jgi:hypothetical protein
MVQAPGWLLCLCANEWHDYCNAGPRAWRTGFCVPCDRGDAYQGWYELDRVLCEPLLCVLALVNPCCALHCGQSPCRANGVRRAVTMCCCAVPPCGWLVGPCVIAGIYDQEQRLVSDTHLPTLACEYDGLPCGVGLPCCLFPCALRQLFRERLHRDHTTDHLSVRDVCRPEDDEHRERQLSERAALNRQKARIAQYGSDLIEITLLTGLWVAHRVHAWRTLEEEFRGVPSIVSALLSRAGRPLLWVHAPVAPTTVVGELWQIAVRQHSQRVSTYKEASMDVEIHTASGDVTHVKLVATDCVAQTAHTIVFSGTELRANACWGEVWEENGMVDGCILVIL